MRLACGLGSFLGYNGFRGGGGRLCQCSSLACQTLGFQALAPALTWIVQRTPGIRIDCRCSWLSGSCRFNDRCNFRGNRRDHFSCNGSLDGWLGGRFNSSNFGNLWLNSFACWRSVHRAFADCCRFSCVLAIVSQNGISDSAGDDCGNDGGSRLVSFGYRSLGIIFRTFYPGLALAITAVAAPTLTARATTWAIAFCTVSSFGGFILQQFFVWQLVLGCGCSLLGTGLAQFAWRTFAALTAWCLCLLPFCCRAFFAWFAWLTQFAWLPLFTWRAGLTGLAWRTLGALATWLLRFLGFTGRALFARFALFITIAAFVAVVATTSLLTLATRAISARGALTAWLFRGYRLGCFFLLSGKQTDQRFDHALEQAGFRLVRRSERGGSSRGGCRTLRGDSFDGRFLTYQCACGTDRLSLFHFARGHFIAGLAGLHFRAVVAQALHFEVRGFHMVIRQNDDARTGPQFDLGDVVALLVEQEGGNRNRHLGTNLGSAILQCFFFDQAQNRQRQRLDIADDALTGAARADDTAAFAQRWTQTLTGHFQQAEARDAANLDARTIGFQALAHAIFHGALVLWRGHVDEVDDDQAADITQAQLPGNFFSRFEVGIECGFLDVAAAGGARRVDVDGHQGFGRVDDDGAAGRQLDNALEGGFDLAFDLETIEQRHAVFVELDLAGVLRHHLIDEAQGFFLGFDAIDQHFTDILAQIVTDSADDHVGFLIDQERRLLLLGGFLDGFPQLGKVIQVPLHFFAGATQAGGTYDQAHVGGDVEAVQRFAQFVALFAFDAAGDAAGARVVRHQHQITTSQTDKGGQGCALVATLFFLDLNDDFLAFFEHVFNVDATFGGLGEIFAGDFF